ncbi:hypothetical protein Rhopal_001309-T1 [Rhodotorula paludigena]|uniref:Translation initiation factor eIF2B subunit alpha n=1 Tax=Rhodotorula paludigena TaxID=86838 RepID=A0AAV5GCZ2_9BASI|nr:hypothetical protein Rhopal_001309-T1 [Rhodotorula paludigena]
MALPALDEDAPLVTPQKTGFDVVQAYAALLERDDPMPAPVAAVEALAELVSRSDSSTIQELLALLRQASAQLAAASFNPISAQSGTALFMRYLTLQRPPPEMSFAEFKSELVQRAREFVRNSSKCRDAIAVNMSSFIQDGNRVVVQALLYAAQTQKKRFQVYVTESRPFGLGLKTHAVLTEAGIPCVVVLDSAVAYIMAKCDLALVGAEAVCESGGLVNFIGGYQMAIAAKALGKPFYDALASEQSKGVPATPVRPMIHSTMPDALEMSDAATRHNPILDYTTPDQGVSDALFSLYGG